MPTIDTNFSAREPSLGYVYQIKYALLLLITNSRTTSNPKIRIENLDDIEIENIDSIQLFQTKLHIKSKATLTNASVDFWKTIRIWADHIKSGLIELESTLFALLTTESVSEESVLVNFKKENLNSKEIDHVVKKLDEISTSSNNQSIQEAFKAYGQLDINQKKILIARIRIFDASISIPEIDEKIKKEIAMFVYPKKVEAFIERLEGWWLKQSINMLQGKIEFVQGDELQHQISAIRDEFSADNLPNHFPDQLEITDIDLEKYKQKTFLKQLDLVEVRLNSHVAKRAISDFRRAYEQRSKWLRLQLLNPEEEEIFDKRLKDYWQNIFEILCDECTPLEVEELVIKGKEFYLEQFAKRCPQIKIREKFNEEYLIRGSYHMLSDKKKIGWHPKYNENI
ncbi:MAG: hypothetical protein EOO06_13430 [Chitinophagaceae bacterium]|nr:MAG: hypothetical protein EOO06_13430 [Chitinophagaceae bacterium]